MQTRAAFNLQLKTFRRTEGRVAALGECRPPDTVRHPRGQAQLNKLAGRPATSTRTDNTQPASGC